MLYICTWLSKYHNIIILYSIKYASISKYVWRLAVQGIPLVHDSVLFSLFWLILSCCCSCCCCCWCRSCCCNRCCCCCRWRCAPVKRLNWACSSVLWHVFYLSNLSSCLVFFPRSLVANGANGNDMPKKRKKQKQRRRNPNGFLLPKAFKSETSCQVAGERSVATLLLLFSAYALFNKIFKLISWARVQTMRSY